MTLATETKRVLERLTIDAAPVADLGALPDAAGLYTFWPRTPQALSDLGLADVDGEAPLAARALYLGKAQDGGVRDRVHEKHLAAGETGRSTFRRSLAALLGLRAMPRSSKFVHPTRRQLMTMTANFALVPDDDAWLSIWMLRNLEVRAAACAYSPLKALERAVAAHARPTLDQEPVPLWTPNPWRQLIADAQSSRSR